MATCNTGPTINSFTEALRRPSRNFPRSISGCLTCRQRRKRCDEQRPTCSGCLCSHVVCRWPAPSASTRSPTSLAAGMRLQQQELRQSYINTEAVDIRNLSHLTVLSPEPPCFLTNRSGTCLSTTSPGRVLSSYLSHPRAILLCDCSCTRRFPTI
jgi:hypothetical protein